MAGYSWRDADQVVVHAMADGEWGGTQFQVASATVSKGANPILNFSMGGFQQARTAMLTQGNRYYMEGSVEFLDEQGEWYFNRNTSELLVFPPTGLSLSAETTEIVLTQTDTLFELTGSASDSGKRVEHITFSNLSFAFTSAQFFRPHEETSGGDYATHRSGAVKMEK